MRLFGFLEPARIEFEDAIDFYNQQSPKLGNEFAAEVLNHQPYPGSSRGLDQAF